MDITVVRGDITRQEVDAVVNAASREVRGGGGVDGAIHRAGGPVVLADCRARFPDGLATGDAGWTTAGAMPARWVIHVVGPNFTAGERDRSLLLSCYSRALAVADSLGASTVAFPLVSAGIYGWPMDDAIAAPLEVFESSSAAVAEARWWPSTRPPTSRSALLSRALRDHEDRGAPDVDAAARGSSRQIRQVRGAGSTRAAPPPSRCSG